MPYICKNCPNKGSFQVVEYGTCDYSERQTINEEGETMDSDGMEYDNHEQTNTENHTCAECGSNDVRWVDQDEWEDWKGPIPPEKQDDENWQDYLKRKKRT